MARHIASHAVTVTGCDTVFRASRHIRPSIEGGVHVTRDAEQKIGLERPHHTQHSDNGRNFTSFHRQPRIRVHIQAGDRQSRDGGDGERQITSNLVISRSHLCVSKASNAIPCGSRLAISRDCTPYNSLQDNETRRQHPVFADQREQLHARVANHVFHSVEPVGRARGPGDRRNVQAGEMPGIEADHLSESRGWGGKTAARLILDVYGHFRGSSEKTVAVRSLQNLGGRLQKFRVRP